MPGRQVEVVTKKIASSITDMLCGFFAVCTSLVAFYYDLISNEWKHSKTNNIKKDL